MYNYFRAAYYLACMMRRACWDHKKLADYQNRKVKEVLRYAYENVPFYHEKFNQTGVKPLDVKTVADLNKLPILRRTEIAENAELMLSREFNAKKLRIVSTSGSTGRPLFTRISRKEDEFRKAKHLRANIAVGQKPRDRWVVVTAPHHFSEVTRLQRFLGIYAATPLSVFEEPVTQIAAIKCLRPDILDGYSSSLLLLAQELEKTGTKISKPKFVIGGAELIDSSSQQLIEKAFNAPFYDQYACVELERLAWQCKEKASYHIDADSVVMQFVDESGEEVAAGEQGEVVCTSLFNCAMPFIRYALEDVGIPSDETNCPCGRTLPQMKVIAGRKDSILLLPGGRSMSPLAIGDCMIFFKYFSHIDQYRVTQKRIDLLTFLVKKKDDSIEDRVMEAELRSHIRKMMHIGEPQVTIEVDFTDEIPLDTSGKLRKVVSEIKNHE